MPAGLLTQQGMRTGRYDTFKHLHDGNERVRDMMMSKPQRKL